MWYDLARQKTRASPVLHSQPMDSLTVTQQENKFEIII